MLMKLLVGDQDVDYLVSDQDVANGGDTCSLSICSR
jgi:hypothetical protein